MRRLLIAIMGGFLVTVVTVLSGVSCGSHWSLMCAVDHVPIGELDRTYAVGWVQLVSGEIKRYACDRIQVPGVSEFSRQLRSAKLAGRAKQVVIYNHRQRGFPFLCVEYFWNAGGPYGSHARVPRDKLEYYPEYRFGTILWAGLCRDVGVWSVLTFIVATAPLAVRILYRRRRGLCIKCGYQLYGLIEERCPECGTPFAAELLRDQQGGCCCHNAQVREVPGGAKAGSENQPEE